jgi:hypothetical protein
MIIKVFAEDFPEFLMPIAEENFIRGYQQALDDVEAGKRMVEEENAGNGDLRDRHGRNTEIP